MIDPQLLPEEIPPLVASKEFAKAIQSLKLSKTSGHPSYNYTETTPGHVSGGQVVGGTVVGQSVSGQNTFMFFVYEIGKKFYVFKVKFASGEVKSTGQEKR